MTHYVTKASSDKVSRIDQFSGTKVSGDTAVGHCPLPTVATHDPPLKTVGCTFGLLRRGFTHPLSARAYRARPHPLANCEPRYARCN
jgi:hypothetical protein